MAASILSENGIVMRKFDEKSRDTSRNTFALHTQKYAKLQMAAQVININVLSILVSPSDEHDTEVNVNIFMATSSAR